jgi:hypothetical protein
MKSCIFFKPAASHVAETVVFTSLGLAGVLGVAAAAFSMLEFVAESDAIAAALSGDRAVVAENAHSRRHLGMTLQQVKADANSVVAGLRYILDPRG